MQKILEGWVRHGLTAVGGGTVVASDDLVVQIAGALVVLGGFLWSAWVKRGA